MGHQGRVLLLLVAALSVLSGCGGNRLSSPEDVSFYYWRTVYRLDSTERSALRDIGTRRLFVRMMDVDKQGPNGEAIPVSAVSFAEPVPDSISVVPVVYIVNNVLTGLSGGELDDLAANICQFVDGKIEQAGKDGYDELQLDCDWTATTRDTYFTLLERIRARIPDSVRLTATLRLHQVRNPHGSGVPPADRVLLMCYNMGNLRQPGEHNSILDLGTMDTYLKGFMASYPLPADIALPLFSWSVVFRDGEYAGISKRLDSALLRDTSIFAKEESPSLYRLKVPLPSAGLRRDDIVRREETRWEDLSAAADFLAKYKKKEEFTLLFYHLDSQVLSDFPNEQLQEIVRRF